MSVPKLSLTSEMYIVYCRFKFIFQEAIVWHICDIYFIIIFICSSTELVFTFPLYWPQPFHNRKTCLTNFYIHNVSIPNNKWCIVSTFKAGSFCFDSFVFHCFFFQSGFKHKARLEFFQISKFLSWKGYKTSGKHLV